MHPPGAHARQLPKRRISPQTHGSVHAYPDKLKRAGKLTPSVRAGTHTASVRAGKLTASVRTGKHPASACAGKHAASVWQAQMCRFPPHLRVEPHALVNDARGVAQRAQVLNRHFAVPQQLIHLSTAAIGAQAGRSVCITKKLCCRHTCAPRVGARNQCPEVLCGVHGRVKLVATVAHGHRQRACAWTPPARPSIPPPMRKARASGCVSGPDAWHMLARLRACWTHLLPDLVSYVWVLCHQVKRPRQHSGRGLVAGHQHCHQVVSQLLGADLVTPVRARAVSPSAARHH